MLLTRPHNPQKGGKVGASTAAAKPPKQAPPHQAAYPRLPPLLRLHNELLDFCDLLAPTRAELQDRQRVAKVAADTVSGWGAGGGGWKDGCTRSFVFD